MIHLTNNKQQYYILSDCHEENIIMYRMLPPRRGLVNFRKVHQDQTGQRDMDKPVLAGRKEQLHEPQA